MATVKFMDVTVGQKFRGSTNNGPVNDYVKIPEERMSCCVAINAALVSDPKQRVQFTPLIEVELIEDQVQ